MLILGIQGSPRRKGNTSKLLSTFLTEAENLGAHTQYLDVPRMNISPCQECGACEKNGFCPIDDDMQHVFFLLRRADIIVMATPVFFYGPTAQLKALIDRAQTLWSRKYVHRLIDPGEKWRCGFFISVGATKGKDLFEGISLTAKYFFDAVGANFKGDLTYPKIEEPEDIEKHPTAFDDARGKARSLVAPFLDRKKVLFLCTENACRSQMAGAFTGHYAGDRLDVDSAGSSPANEINPVMENAMAEKGIDMAYRKPKSLEDITKDWLPDIIISMGCGDVCPMFPGVETIAWDLPDPAGKPIEFMREIRDDIEEKVKTLFL